eukprot:2354131-Pyramimonas_sp.AAC.1
MFKKSAAADASTAAWSAQGAPLRTCDVKDWPRVTRAGLNTVTAELTIKTLASQLGTRKFIQFSRRIFTDGICPRRARDACCMRRDAQVNVGRSLWV